MLTLLKTITHPHPLLGGELEGWVSDASWYQFTEWLEYYAKLHGITCIAVPPHFTSQECSNCGQTVKKSLSVRTHKCSHCGYIADRDHNAARNILAKGLEMLGAIVNSTEGHASCLLRRSCANGGAASERGAASYRGASLTLTLTESEGNLKATGESGLWISDSNMANLSCLYERRIINDENPAS